MIRYTLSEDIIIPAGTPVFKDAPVHIERFVPYALITIGPTKDTTFNWSMPLDEALEIGLVRATVED